MAQVELDSFVTKLKSLLQLGFSATLHIEAEAGKASVCLKADLGYSIPPSYSQISQKSRQRRGPAYSRRQERRRQEFNAQAINTVERGNDDDAETADNHSASVGITIPNIEVTEQVTGEATQHHSSSELEDYKAMITELKQTIVDLEKEI